MNKVRKLAEELLTKYPTMFSTNFEANKKALEKVAVIRNRALRNQIAGAISSMFSERNPAAKQEIEEAGRELEDLIPTENSSVQAEDNSVASQ